MRPGDCARARRVTDDTRTGPEALSQGVVSRWVGLADGEHDWSPDGKHIVVSLNANEGSRPHASSNVAILRPDGSHLRRLTQFAGRKINALARYVARDLYRLLETGAGAA